jgi:hypothetical protein
MPVIQHDIGVFLNCDRDDRDCERVERLPNPRSSGRGSSTAYQKLEKQEARKLMQRLKAVGLWPPPEGVSVEDLVAALRRREEGEAD